MNEVNFITGKKKDLFWPVVFLSIVVILSILLFLFNLKLDYDNKDLDKKISERTNDISDLKNDPKIQVYSLTELNKSTIENLEKRSNITKYIQHIDAISKKYDISFESFNISQWSVQLQALSNSNDIWIAYIKASKFIEWYRKEKSALLWLKFIPSFEWMDSIKFNIDLNIK